MTVTRMRDVETELRDRDHGFILYVKAGDPARCGTIGSGLRPSAWSSRSNSACPNRLASWRRGNASSWPTDWMPNRPK